MARLFVPPYSSGAVPVFPGFPERHIMSYRLQILFFINFNIFTAVHGILTKLKSISKSYALFTRIV